VFCQIHRRFVLQSWALGSVCTYLFVPSYTVSVSGSLRKPLRRLATATRTRPRYSRARERSCYSALSLFRGLSGCSHKETWMGCIVSLTTPTRSSLSASRSVSLRSLAEKASRVLAASYLLR
jgi:hypothetical protein